MIEQQNIPSELKALRQWVGWLIETRRSKTTREQKATKVLKNPRTRANASSTDTNTWGTYEEAVKAYESNHVPQFNGIGFVFSENDGYTGIDLDKCGDPQAGSIEPWALDIAKELDSYTEVSPSGTGLHIITRSKLRGQRRKIGHVEMYDHARYFTITGNLIAGIGRSTIEARNLRSLEARFQRGELGPQNSNDTKNKPKERDETESGEDWRILDQIARELGTETPDALETALRERHPERYAERNRVKGDHAGRTYWRYTIERWFERRQKAEDTPAELDNQRLGNEGTSNGLRFARLHSDKARYWPERRKWLLWTGTHWSEDKLRDVRELAKETGRSIFTEAAMIVDDGPRNKRLAWVLQSLQMNGVRDTLEAASSVSGMKVATEQVDANPWLLNFLNGTVDLRNGTLREHRREEYITKLVRCDYSPGIIAPRWLKFLKDTFGSDEAAYWIQRAVGYSLTGITSEKTTFLLIGPTNTGKSTFLEILRVIFEEYSKRLQVESLMWGKGRDNNSDADIADLHGVRFAITSETEEDHRLRESKLKQITQGMGTIRATRKYENPIEFPETHHLWFDANHKPGIAGTDDATWNRLIPIPCSHKLKPEEIDRTLKDKLLLSPA